MGGSLGLFLGFSCWETARYLVGYFHEVHLENDKRRRAKAKEEKERSLCGLCADGGVICQGCGGCVGCRNCDCIFKMEEEERKKMAFTFEML